MSRLPMIAPGDTGFEEARFAFNGMIDRRPVLELQRITGELPFGLRHYWKSHFLRELPDEAIDASIERFAARAPSAHGSEAIEPWSTAGGGYRNYGSPDEPVERIRAAFGDAKFARLQKIKRRWDPDNRFRFNSSIPPTGD